MESINDSTTLNLLYSFIVDHIESGVYSSNELNINSNSSMISRNGQFEFIHRDHLIQIILTLLSIVGMGFI